MILVRAAVGEKKEMKCSFIFWGDKGAAILFQVKIHVAAIVLIQRTMLNYSFVEFLWNTLGVTKVINKYK